LYFLFQQWTYADSLEMGAQSLCLSQGGGRHQKPQTKDFGRRAGYHQFL
jgi:hypothetical protein